MDTRKIKSLVSGLLSWFSANARDLPWRRTRDPYAIWVSEIMLQQTQVKTVIPYWERWMRELPTVQAVAKAKPAKLHKLWEGLGYYTRVRNMQKAAQQIVSQHKALSESRRRRGNESQTKRKLETPYVVSYKFPENYEEVLALPGIGRYTAGAICSIAFNQPRPILDGNVIRVLTRIFGIQENPREKGTNAQLWQLAEELVIEASRDLRTRTKDEDETACSGLNQSLMELGALICTPRQPKCEVCPVSKLCIAFRTRRQEQFPNLGKRAAATFRRFVAFVVERDGRFLVRQRPAGAVNAHLWEFPNTEILLGAPSSRRQVSAPKFSQNASETLALPSFKLASIKPFCTIKHSITRYRITLEAYRARLKKPANNDAGVWLKPEQFRKLAFTAAHKKLASAATKSILSDR